MKLPLLGPAVGVCALAATAACSTTPVGLDSSRLQSQWTSVPTSAWAGVSTVPEVDSQDGPDTDVAQAFENLIELRIQCGRFPQECDVARLAAPGSVMFEHLSDLMAERIETGITATEEGSLRVRVDAVELIEPGKATVTTCLVDDTVLVIESAVYDDSVYSARSTWTLVASGDEWLWSEEQVIEWVVEKDLCADE